MTARRPLRLLVALLIVSAPAVADSQQAADDRGQDQAKPKAKAVAKSRARRRANRPVHRDSPREYMGRPIAEPMSYLGAEWLFRPEREQEERPDEMLDALKIRPGWTVADVGAGAGFTSLRLAKRVGPKGTVLATDLQPEMLRMLRANAEEAGLRNIRPIRCTQADPKLPEGKVDLAIMVDVYHECADPEATLKGIRKALKPGGRLVLVEFRGEDPAVPIKPEHKMTVDQVRKEVEPQDLAFKELLDFLPWQHILIFEKPAKGPPAKPDAKADADRKSPSVPD